MAYTDNIKSSIEALLKDYSTAPSLIFNTELPADVIFALNFCYDTCIKNSKFSDLAQTFVESVLDKVWERLNIGCWKDIPDYLRETYGYASFLKAILLFRLLLQERDANMEKSLRNIVETLDRGLLLGNSHRQYLANIASSLCNLIHIVSEKTPVRELSSAKITNIPKNSKAKAIPILERPSMNTFLRNYFEPQIPLKLTNCVQHWPALRNWSDLNYIIKKIGPRLVPVEIGKSYTSFDWSQKLMSVEDFIKQFVLSTEPSKIGYLAQHQLFNQIPELLDDIRTPDYCIFTQKDESENEIDVNAWFGPANTVSDLHYDPKHNFLVQVVGSKYVLLVDPKWSENVYPRDDHLLFNTAMVDVENPNYESFPKFKDVELIECYLNAGDMLYIPPKWWHHIRSLSTSFSVSFWWGS